MLLRLVRLPLQPEGVAAFLALFERSRARIRQQPGCQHLALWQDADHPHTYCTLSHWSSAAALNRYRRSALFGEVWPATKRLLAAPPIAFSLTSVPASGFPGTIVPPVPAPAAQPSNAATQFHPLNPFESVTYFEFYDLPESFLLDEAALKRRYYQLSRELHPDFHAQDTPAEQAQALHLSTLNTDAYRTLADPDRRMAYLLGQHGLLEEGSAQNQLPPDFLLEVMELNEQLMELEFDPEPAATAQLGHDVMALADTLDAGIQPVLAGYPGLPSDHRPAALQQVKTYYLKKRYLLRLRQQLATFAARS